MIGQIPKLGLWVEQSDSLKDHQKSGKFEEKLCLVGILLEFLVHQPNF